MKQGVTLALLAVLLLGAALAGKRQPGSDTLAFSEPQNTPLANVIRGTPRPRSAGCPVKGAAGTLHDLGLLVDGVSPAIAINSDGEVVGGWRTDLGANPAFDASEAVTADSAPRPDESASAVCGINKRGQIVGWADGGGRMRHALLLEAGAKSDLGTLGGPESEAFAINNAGQIIGRAALPDGSSRAFLYHRGVMQDLGTLGGEFSVACAINDAGEVAGWATTARGRPHAFLYGRGAMIDLGTLGGGWSRAHGINAAGEVVGAASVGRTGHAFLVRRGAMRDLGTLGGGDSTAYGINNGGEVVGCARTAAGEEHAFRYCRGVLTDLNRLLPAGSGWILTRANAINDADQIAGSGLFHGQRHAFLWTPFQAR